MDEGNKTMIVFFLLFVFSGKPAEGQSLLDVCSTCHANATCDDKSDGSGKVCNCKYGFVGNGRTFCQDKDECQIGSSKICGQHTTCHNTFGSYYCTCLTGYSPSNNMAVFIPNDGTHCQDIDECRITGQCGEGAQCRNLEGSFDCSCQVGYKIYNGVEPFNPLRDKASCKVVDCGPPALLEDTFLLSVTGTTYSSVATFICDEGFVWRRGDNSSVCGAEGLWSEPNMVCEEVDCGSPPAVPHSRLLWNKSTRMGTEVVYQCNSGYHNVGKGNVSICTAAGQWAGPSVLCREILCGNPPVIEFTGQVWSYNSTPGSTVLYFCKDGFYNKGGNNVSTCQENGQWTSPTLSCQEILCGDPPNLPHTGQLWKGSSTPGSTVIYYCKKGFYHSDGNNVSVCTINGYWTKPDISCKEVDCGKPLLIPNSVMYWDKISTVGSKVIYQCKPGYRNAGTGNVSVCSASGKWDAAPILCQEINCWEPVLKPNAKMLWDGTSRVGSVVYYQCAEGYYTRSLRNYSVCGENGLWEDIDLWCEAKCGPAPFLANSKVVWHNRSIVIHRCVAGYHSWRGSNVSVCGSSGEWQKATLRCIEIKPPINHLLIFNESCLQWKAEKYEEDTEIYKVTYTGSRDYQRPFYNKRKRFLRSKADQLKLCLSLLPVTNYSITVTATSARFTASVTTNTSLPVPPGPVVYYREFDTPLPTLSLRRSPNTLDLISLYQVFVLPVEGIMMFNCSSPPIASPLRTLKSPAEYITAQFEVHRVGTEMNLTIGDGLLYGGFHNAPLESGKNYYIILRAVSQWKSALKSSCVLWAKVTATSYALRVSSLSAVATIGLVAVVIWGGYSITWCFKKT
ncbi:sushi domain-containing protein 1 isoform X2 [Oreochromis niloticus]|uniref:sushi domain-containing protein 1 isoform X2 n=1 Tax=Oreochromis niloticus TaxID=8128 RepID=UPI000DF412F6|nr:sushi domain-containing protein 1 isoform X2 [Oreochromis niloticus]